MKNANYSDSWVDLQIKGSTLPLKIQRHYNSRSLFNGLFGFGWCSDYEMSLKVDKKDQLVLKDCDREVVYYKKGKSYQSPGVRKIVPTKNSYILKKENGEVIHFSLQGQLVLRKKERAYLVFSYLEDRLVKVENEKKVSLKFHYLPGTKTLHRIESSLGYEARYILKNSNLLWVKNQWKNSYTYKYDDVHNLLEVAYPDGTKKELSYDKKKDWVLSFKGRDRCIENYQYLPQEDDPKNHYISISTKTCFGEIVQKVRYEFWHKEKNGRKYLAKFKVESGDKKEATEFDTIHGQPLSIEKNGEKTSYSYRKDGKLLQIRKNGQVFAIHYDKNGRIRSLKIGKKSLRLSYSKSWRFPTSIESGEGALHLTYGENNRVKKVLSTYSAKDRQTVAKLFSEFLRLAGPALKSPES